MFLQYRDPGLLSLLGKVRFDVTVRQLLRDMLILVGLLRIDGINPTREQAPLLVALCVFYALHFACQAAAVVVRRTRTLPIVTRNIDASALRLTAAPPRILARRPGHRLLTFSDPDHGRPDGHRGHHGRVLGRHRRRHRPRPGLGGGTAYLATWLLPKKRAKSEQKVMEWLDKWLADYQPTVGHVLLGRHDLRVPGEHVALHALLGRREAADRAA